MAVEQMNGPMWPDGLSGDVHELPDRFDHTTSPLELAQAYATIALAYGQNLPKIVQALEFLRSAGHNVAFELGRLGAEVKRLTDAKAQSLPPMRPPLESSHQIIEQGKREAELQVKEEARRSAGPIDMVDPSAAARISADVFAKLMAEREAEIKARADADRLAALEEAEAKRIQALADATDQHKKDVRKVRVTVYGAVAVWVVLGILGAMAGLVWVGAKTVAARELGHQEGVREVRELVAPQAPAMSAPASPALH